MLKDYHQEDSYKATAGRVEQRREGDWNGENWGSKSQAAWAGKHGPPGGWRGSTNMKKAEESVLENALGWASLLQIQ